MPVDSRSNNHFDVIVLGLGGVGSSVLYHLAKRGVKVLGIEQYGPVHDRGSSHGETRAIRKAYFEHPDYVPLLHRAYDLWRELESESGRSLYQECGIIIAGEAESESVQGSLQAAKIHSLTVNDYSAAEARAEFPGFHFDDEQRVVFEPEAGYLRVEECVEAQLNAACRMDVVVANYHEPCKNWRVDGDSVIVETEQNMYHTSRLIITAGAWSGQLLSDLGLKLEVRRKQQVWMPLQKTGECPRPVFFYDLPDGCYYGFPSLDGDTIKMAEHSGGEIVDDPAAVNRELKAEDITPLTNFASTYLKHVEPICSDHSTCLYTMSPDGHFIVDRHPEYPQVSFAAGLSGHGFKFASVLGEVLADLAIDGRTELPVGFLSLDRFSQH
ncbi:N-methyl-L-tryptophan oxidase [Calycomorphotria hydatis]|uniref:Monomeric sarcosine oxidase n=1 Tax=Calycomorphotria hydatis TaxID=2528027 RepID=A0A517TAZ5_9PLAN|nr:N-methyl-L-tryptophan oxidase [Calycomorphotria hydatis]QDT65546.1 Monomeric sarcosine oxidase [Calycomorphotria hydatis]